VSGSRGRGWRRRRAGVGARWRWMNREAWLANLILPSHRWRHHSGRGGIADRYGAAESGRVLRGSGSQRGRVRASGSALAGFVGRNPPIGIFGMAAETRIVGQGSDPDRSGRGDHLVRRRRGSRRESGLPSSGVGVGGGIWRARIPGGSSSRSALRPVTGRRFGVERVTISQRGRLALGLTGAFVPIIAPAFSGRTP